MTWVDELRRHEAVFRRAPSAHNTQPWTLSYGTDEIVIGTDPARTLPASDPHARDLALGLGAFLETCLIVAASAGLPVTGDLTDPRTIRLIPAASLYATPFTAAEVNARRVARGPYAPGTLAPEILAELEPGLIHLPSRSLAADLTVADRWSFGTPPVVHELRRWLRLNPDDPRYHRDGLTDRALTLSRPTAILLAAALRAYPWLRPFGLPALLAASSGNPLRHHGSVLVLTTPRPASSPQDLREDGRRLMRTWLTLARHGLAVHPLSQLIDCPETGARLTERIGSAPLALFRAGRPTHEPVRSARCRTA